MRRIRVNFYLEKKKVNAGEMRTRLKASLLGPVKNKAFMKAIKKYMT